MAFTLTAPADQTLRKKRVNLDNTDPEDIFKAPEEAAPAPAPAPDPATPTLRFSKQATTTDNANAAIVPKQPEDAPYDNVALDQAELADRSLDKDKNPYLADRGPLGKAVTAKNNATGEDVTIEGKQHNSKLKSALLGMLAGGGEAANRALARGDRNPLAAAIGGAAGGGIAGGVHDRWDEEQKNEERKAELEHNIGFTLAKRAQEADTEYKTAQPGIEQGRINATLANAALTRNTAMVNEQGRNTRNQATLKQRQDAAAANLAETKRYHDQELGAKNSEIPKEYYRGRDPGAIKDAALQSVFASGDYDESQIRPEVLQLFGNDQNKLTSAIKSGSIPLAQVFKDPAKGLAFQAALATAHSTLQQQAGQFDRALGMTSKNPQASRISYADFETTYEKFMNDYKAAADGKTKESPAQLAIRNQFEKALSKVRLTGQ